MNLIRTRPRFDRPPSLKLNMLLYEMHRAQSSSVVLHWEEVLLVPTQCVEGFQSCLIGEADPLASVCSYRGISLG